MTKSRKTQANHSTRPKAANLAAAKPETATTRQEVESFIVFAQRLGAALADVIEHPDCPGSVADAISELDTQVFNRCNDLEISLRHSFAYRLAAELERRD